MRPSGEVVAGHSPAAPVAAATGVESELIRGSVELTATFANGFTPESGSQPPLIAVGRASWGGLRGYERDPLAQASRRASFPADSTNQPPSARRGTLCHGEHLNSLLYLALAAIASISSAA